MEHDRLPLAFSKLCFAHVSFAVFFLFTVMQNLCKKMFLCVCDAAARKVFVVTVTHHNFAYDNKLDWV